MAGFLGVNARLEGLDADTFCGIQKMLVLESQLNVSRNEFLYYIGHFILRE